MISIAVRFSNVRRWLLPSVRHRRVDKPRISLRDRVDNRKTVIHTYAPFAHTSVENDQRQIDLTLTRFACLSNFDKRLSKPPLRGIRLIHRFKPNMA